MPNYRELLQKAANQRANRDTFADRATRKAIELHNALIEELGAPADSVVTHDLKAGSDDVDLGSGYVLTSEGVRFGISLQLGQYRVGSVCLIKPKGQRLFCKIEALPPVDVTDAAGISEWCDIIAGVFEEHLDNSLTGRISREIET